MDEYGWGYGGAIVSRMGKSGFAPGSYGWTGGYGTSFVLDPARNLTAILLTRRLMTSPNDVAHACQACAAKSEETR